jgi:hypothetical protein
MVRGFPRLWFASLILGYRIDINIGLINVRHKCRRAIFSHDLQLRAKLRVPYTPQEMLLPFPSPLFCHYLLLCIEDPFLWTEYLLRCEASEDVVPYLQKYWTQFLLNVLIEVLCKKNEGV